MKKILIFILIIPWTLSLEAQVQSIEPSLIGSTGGSAQVNPNLNLDWAVGEVVTFTGSTPGKILTQGFLQPIIQNQATNFLMINVEDGSLIRVLEDGDSIPYSTLPTSLINLQANVNPTGVGSVRIGLRGLESNFGANAIRNESPYFLFEEDGDILPPDTYRLWATFFSEPDGQGTVLETLEVFFKLTNDDPGKITQLFLIDADTDEIITEITDQTVIPVKNLSQRELNIWLKTKPNPIGSMSVKLTGPFSKERFEQASPYSVFGNLNEDFLGEILPAGVYNLVAQTFSKVNTSGTPGSLLDLDFELVEVNDTSIVTLEMGSTRAVLGEVFELPIRVENFASISGFQFLIKFPADQLNYIETIRIDSTLDALGNISIRQLDDGSILILWTEDLFKGVTLNNDSEIFTLRWKSTGNNADTFLVNIEESFVSDPNGDRIPSQGIAGTVTIIDEVNIQGIVLTEDKLPINKVNLSLTNNTETFTQVTGLDGLFSFTAVPVVGLPDYTLSPEKTDSTNDNTTVNILDRLKILRHIAGIQLLDSPFKILAADVNFDQQIDNQDVAVIDDLIFGLTRLDPSWRFIPENFIFVDPTNPFSNPIPNTLFFPQLDAPVGDADFTGVRIGDVNNTRDVTKSVAHPVALSFDKAVELNEFEILVPVMAQENYRQILGWQGTFSYDSQNWIFERIQAGQLAAENISVSTKDAGYLPFLYASTKMEGESLNPNSQLFGLVFRKKSKDIQGIHLNFGSDKIPVAIYGEIGLKELDLTMSSFQEESSESIYIHPNPGSVFTVDFLSLPLGKVMLTLRNLQGEIIETWEIENTDGQASITLDLKSKQTGLYLLTVQAENSIGITRRIIIDK